MVQRSLEAPYGTAGGPMMGNSFARSTPGPTAGGVSAPATREDASLHQDVALSDVRRAARAAARAPYVLIIACALAATVELAVSALVGRSFGKGGTAAELASFFSTLTVLVAITAVLGDRWMRRRPGR